MTNQQPRNSEENQQQSLSFGEKLTAIIAKPQTQLVSLLTIMAIVAGGYVVSRHLITKVIPSQMEKELERIFDRDVSLGKVTSFSWNQVIIENLAIPPTKKDVSFVEIDAIKINVDLLSLIFHRHLLLDIIASDVNGYAQLDTLFDIQKQKTLPNSLKLPPLPIETIISLRLNHSKIAITPNMETKAVEIKTKGKLKLIYDNDTQPLSYELENTINNSEINIKGETLLSNTSSKNELEIRYLYLPEVVSLIPNLPLEIKEGRLNSNLELVTLSLPQFPQTIITGKISLEDVEGKLNINEINVSKEINNIQKVTDKEKSRKIPLLEKSFTGNASLNLQNNSLNIETANFTFGELGGFVKGDIGIDTGYNLMANLNPVIISKVLPSLNIQSPVKVDGLLSGNFLVKGEIDNPQILGKVRIKNSQVDKLELGEINSQFLANLDNVTIKEVTVKPPTGGKIVTQGVINTNFSQTLNEGKSIKVEKIPFNFRFTANLPSTELINSYDILPTGIDIGNLLTAGEIKGNLNQPQGRISFSLPNITGEKLGIISTQGKFVINKNEVNLLDTELVINKSRIQINGESNFKEKTWQLSALSNNINLTPFLDQFCQTSANCENLPVNFSLPIKAKDLDISLKGSFEEEETQRQGDLLVNISEKEEKRHDESNGLAKINFNNVEGEGKVNLVINDGNLRLDTRLVNGNLFINGKANQISVNNLFPSLPTTTHLISSQFKISGDVKELIDIGNENRENLPPSLTFSADSQLRIENGLVETATKIDEEKTEFSADFLSQLSLNQFIPTLNGEVNSSQINLSAKTKELYQLARQSFNFHNFSTINSLNLTGNFQGRLADGNFNTQARINNGIFSLDGVTKNISLSQLLPETKINAKNLNTNISISSNFSELVTFAINYIDSQSFSPLPSLNLLVDGKTNIAQGRIFLSTKINNSQWQSNIKTQNLNLESFNQQLAFLPSSFFLEKEIKGVKQFNNVNSEINMRGNLPVFGEKITSFPVNLESAFIEAGKNTVNAKGNFNLVNILTKPDVNNLQLQVTANSNLNIIPINQLFSQESSRQGVNFLPQSLNLEGKVNFQGVLSAQNLLTNPLGKNNLNIEGNLSLTNLNFNQLKFESLLTGKVAINPSQKIVLDLRGKEDIIAANFVKQNLSIPSANLTLPFTPNSLEINKIGNFPFNFQGRREDNQFIVSLHNFSLETLQLQPVISYGIKGKIQGNLATNFTLNLTDLTAKGDLKLNNLGIGNIIGKQFTTNFYYQNNIAQLDNGQLKFGETIYDLQGKINLATQDIQGKINLQGKIEDIFNTLKITDVATLTGLLKQWQNENYFVAASAIPSQSLGNQDDSIKTKVNLLSSIDDQIRAIAKQIESGTIPNDLDISGAYEGEILLGGKLSLPEIGVNLEGNQWQWLPQQPFPNIVNSLGLIIQESQAIPIQKIALNANFKNDNLTVNPFRLNLGNSQIFFAGNLSPKTQEGKFQIIDFPLDFVTAFFPLPFDINSLIDMEGNIAGNLLNPEIKGNLTLNNTALDGAIIEDKINTEFTYKNYQLDIATIDSKNINFNASLPYHPLTITDKPAIINLQLDTENITFLELLTKGQLQLKQGKISTNLAIKIDSFNKLFNNFNIDKIKLGGNINFEDAIINSVSLNTPVNLSGNINLIEEKQAIDVSNLEAKINNTDIKITGILPLINPLKDNENILTLNIPNQALQVKNIYSGKVDADIKIDGTVLKPKIGGYVSLNNGNFSLRETETNNNVSQPKNKQLSEDWLGKKSASNSSFFQPELQNFTLKLNNTTANQWRFYRFLFGGELVLNGGVLNLENLRADGAINIRRGQIYLGGASPLVSLTSDLAVGQTTFFLSRTNNNRIIFDKNENILNPDIDLELQADIVDYSRQLPTTQQNEISDPIIRGGRGENIQVVLGIKGGLAQLLPVLGDNNYGVCRVPASTPIADNIQLSPSQLDKVSQCINLAVLNKQGTNLNLLNSPLVSLSSTPNRSEGELINLIIGGQLFNLATQLQELSGEQLFENGLVQFILVPLANNISFGVNEKVSTWGKPLGMKDLRVFPLVEGVYEVKDNSNVTVSYDYIYGEFKVRYQMRF
ncbi:translocation/assembly module TamB domain-containing protein [Geminocystis sp. GBBB08]|uniref:translocation/assembly module TamB domain-containing protein n=1 Tax=Geminocystis sp. GBBB08 TaxID=2604140 RepID=UPI0027E36823|nr:translocation/assembly module TamB domain-containing protein [Geminocystis sp. GBBB08]MBL1208790.1 hypothetical protein [Geminocystis sp. GBBB08]